jgi:thymidylate synthase
MTSPSGVATRMVRGSLLPFFDVYGALLAWVFEGPTEVNRRTGVKIRVGRGGTSFRVDLSDGLLPTIGYRKTFPRSAAAETAWYLLGHRDVSFINKYAPLWDKFTENLFDEQGDLYHGVRSAYGYRWRRHFKRDQLALAMEALRRDPSDRRCYVSAWDPSLDGLGATGQLNVPCPTAFSLSVLEGELHSSITLRSSDLFVGLPYDVMGHALLMDAVAHELRIRPGVMHVTLAHAHLYEMHWDMVVESLRQEPVVPKLQLPGWTVSQVVSRVPIRRQA